MITRILKILIIVDIGVILFCWLQGNNIWMLNSQVAFISSLAIVGGSFLSYRGHINKRAGAINAYDDRDEVDKIDDPYDLYGEDHEELEKLDIKEEKKRINRDSMKNLFKHGGAYVSLYRIIGYVVLIAGFMWLNRSGNFDLWSFMFGLMIVPAVVFFSSFAMRNKEE